MSLREFLNTCGNEWRFVKLFYVPTRETDEFDKSQPDYVFSDMRNISDGKLDSHISCWYIESNSDGSYDFYILL